MDPYQDGPKTSTILSLLAALCIFGGLYIIIPKYMDKAPIVETTSVVADLNNKVNPIPARQHEAQSLTNISSTGVSAFDSLFSRVEKNMQYEHCTHFAQLDYLHAWLRMCESKAAVSDACVTALEQSAKNTGLALAQSLNGAMGSVCGCALNQQESRAVEDMLKRSNEQCKQKYTR